MPSYWQSARPPSARMSLLVLVAALAAASPQPASAGIVMVTGNGDILTPGVNATGALKNFFQDTGANPKVHGWNEQQNVTLSRDIYVDVISDGSYDQHSNYGTFKEHKIAKGTVVSSHLLYYDPKTSKSVKGVTFEFDSDILGVIIESDRFHKSAFGFTDYFVDSDFLANPLSDPSNNYPGGHFTNRGLELGPDTFTVSLSGRKLTIDSLTASNPGDQIRVITAGGGSVIIASTPAPPGVLLGLAGAVTFGGYAGLNWLRRRLARN